MNRHATVNVTPASRYVHGKSWRPHSRFNQASQAPETLLILDNLSYPQTERRSIRRTNYKGQSAGAFRLVSRFPHRTNPCQNVEFRPHVVQILAHRAPFLVASLDRLGTWRRRSLSVRRLSNLAFSKSSVSIRVVKVVVSRLVISLRQEQTCACNSFAFHSRRGTEMWSRMQREIVTPGERTCG